MFNQDDIKQIKEKNISLKKIEEYIRFFQTGFDSLKIKDSATTQNGGILTFSDKEKDLFIKEWENYQKSNKNIVKFVPASGAASRMFKDLFEFLNSDETIPTKTETLIFFNNIEKFAFFEDLNEACFRNENQSVKELIAQQKYKTIVKNLLEKQGLNYGFLPKGLLKFHFYPAEVRTPFHEHLLEGALYAANNDGSVHLHFTVSPEHKGLFTYLADQEISKYSQRYKINFDVQFSEQKSSTDTIAVDTNNKPFRENGRLLFRPGGHGALIENLNDIQADIIFIKNIDNVVPDRLKGITVIYKKALAGILVAIQKQIFDYLQQLDNYNTIQINIDSIYSFVCDKLHIHNNDFENLSDSEKIEFLRSKLNRPIRVCGMVRNQGEPGGGPFFAYNNDGTYSLQILENSQINSNDFEQKTLADSATHFNPVDLVCAVRDYKGEKFNLINFIDPATGFISQKSKNGKELKALELPGLWNGAMSDWNTLFVEVPIDTFNPVKTVNDLLRIQHQ